jgi:Transglutaminase-like superfamily
MYIKKIFLYLCCCFFVINIKAQTIDEVAKIFPNDLAAMLTLNREVKFFMKNNIPVAESKESESFLILDDKANGVYNRHKFYHGFFDELTFKEAYTKAPDGNGYKKIKVEEYKTQDATSNSIFYDDVKETAFDFLALTKGAIAVVNSTSFHKDIHVMGSFYFVSHLPIISANYTVNFNADIDVKYVIKNDPNNTISVTEKLEGNKRYYTFLANNIKTPERFSSQQASSYIYPHVIVYVASYKDEKDKQVNVFNSINDFYNWNYSFLKNVNKTIEIDLQNLTDSLTKGLSSSTQKAQSIFRWVQANIKYVAFEQGLEGFTPRQAHDVCYKKYGDCKDMSSLTTKLLQLAGLKGYYTWIGTRDLAYNYNDVHLPLANNHMISTVQIDSNFIFLDATDPNCIYGFPSHSIQGKQALISINENEYKVLEVPTIDAKETKILDSTFIELDGNGIKGKMSVNYSGYFGNDTYNSLMNRDDKQTKEFVKYKMGKASNKFLLGEYVITKTDEKLKKLNIKTSFEVPDYAKKLGDELYINLNLEKIYASSIIDTSKRKVAMEFDYKFTIEQVNVLEIPKNYEVNYMPPNFYIDNGSFIFKINYTKEKNKLIATQTIINNTLLLQPQSFDKWNNSIKQLVNNYKEQVVLKSK